MSFQDSIEILICPECGKKGLIYYAYHEDKGVHFWLTCPHCVWEQRGMFPELSEAIAAMRQHALPATPVAPSAPVYPEPDWTVAPEWARWWAVEAIDDKTGAAYWFEVEPEPKNGLWEMFFEYRYDNEVPLPLGCDWRLTLRRRPETTQ